MKKLICAMLALVLAIGLLAGCGGSDESAPAAPSQQPADKGESPAVKEPEIDEAYWVLDSMEMEGTVFKSEELGDLFGAAEDILALQFKENGKFVGILFGDYIGGSYTKAQDGYELDIEGEKGKAKISGGILEVELTGGAFTLKTQESRPASFDSNPWLTYEVDFSAEQTRAMSNYIMYGFYHIEDGVLYGLSHIESNDGVLAAMSFHMKGDFPEFDERFVLDAGGCANYVTKHGDYLYYIMNWESIRRIKLDGSDMEILYEGACDYFFIHDERIYFCDENYYFNSCDLNGGDIKTHIAREIYFPYFISSDWLIFQDDADNESLHIYNMTHGTEMNITDFPSYCPILDGKYLYFLDGEGENCNLCRVDMSDPYNIVIDRSELKLASFDFLIDEEYFYGPNNDRVVKEDWKKLGNRGDRLEVVEMYVSEEYTVYHKFDDAGYISEKYLMSKTHNGGTSFK